MKLVEKVSEQGHRVMPLVSRPDERAAAGDRRNRFADEEEQPYQMLWRQLACRGPGEPAAARTLGLTSCTSGEGVSTVTARLALAAGAAGPHRLPVCAQFGSPLHQRA